MQLKFYGADKEVTGSCHCIEVNGKRILIDCGLIQGQDSDKENQSVLPFDAASVDCVLVSHAHIDHTGRIPLLVKNGFKGKIYATGKTCELMRIMLEDSAHIQEMEFQWKQRKRKRSGDQTEQPLYTIQDALNTYPLLRPCRYEDVIEISDGVSARFIDAGHLLGSASIELTLDENGTRKTVVFSGDIGNFDQPIIRDPQYLHIADYVIMESTYGNRMHDKPDDLVSDLAKIIDTTLARGGNVVIPSFAIGRTQELLYHIREIKERFLVKSVPNFPVYVDSPLALEATQIYDGDLSGYADAETIAVLQNGFRPINFPNLSLCRSAEESIALNADTTPKVIISSSGMCEAGRIRHHLKHNLWRSECSVVFVGYQANGTLGRMLLNDVKQIKLFGEQITVQAQIYNYRSMSGHADKKGLLRWISEFNSPLQKVFIVHGEEEAALDFAQVLKNNGYDVFVPDYKAEYDLTLDRCTYEGIPAAAQQSGRTKFRGSAVYQRLQLAGERMLEVITRNEGGANKDLAKFADQLLSLAEKWDR